MLLSTKFRDDTNEEQQDHDTWNVIQKYKGLKDSKLSRDTLFMISMAIRAKTSKIHQQPSTKHVLQR